MSITIEALRAPFEKGIKSPSDFRLGTEFEFFVVDSEFRLIPYCCSGGVEETLEHMSKQCSWEKTLEGGHLVGLHRGGQAVTIEPAGTIEFSTSPVRKLREVESQRNLFLKQLAQAADEFGHQLLMIGVLPYDTVDDVELVPKERYRFMYGYMPQVGSRGREMMKLTSAVQVSIDYESETDAMRKFNVASLCTPAFLALSANSSIQSGEFQNCASIRGHIWEDTDNDRAGIPSFIFKDTLSFSDYVEWALDVPMYFALREGQLYGSEHPTFREFMKGNGAPDATMPFPEAQAADWELHLSTLFPWVRMKNYIEVRAFDMCCPRFQMALVALVKGLFYDGEALDAAESAVKKIHQDNASELISQAARRGLDGEFDGVSIRELSQELLNIARSGLLRQNPEEAHYLTPLMERAENWKFQDVQNSIQTLGVEAHLRQFVPSNAMLTEISKEDIQFADDCNAA